MSLTTQNDDERTVDGQPITFGSSPLVLFEDAAPGGKYTLGLLVENIAGEIADQYADVTVAGRPGALPAAPPAAVAAPSGATAGTLNYHDGDLSFQLDYPAGWRASSTRFGAASINIRRRVTGSTPTSRSS